MVRKEYITPKMRPHKCEAILLKQTSGHHDNGHHYGWDNPNNPHYQDDDEEP